MDYSNLGAPTKKEQNIQNIILGGVAIAFGFVIYKMVSKSLLGGSATMVTAMVEEEPTASAVGYDSNSIEQLQ
jgi:hypothetical protein